MWHEWGNPRQRQWAVGGVAVELRAWGWRATGGWRGCPCAGCMHGALGKGREDEPADGEERCRRQVARRCGGGTPAPGCSAARSIAWRFRDASALAGEPKGQPWAPLAAGRRPVLFKARAGGVRRPGAASVFCGRCGVEGAIPGRPVRRCAPCGRVGRVPHAPRAVLFSRSENAADRAANGGRAGGAPDNAAPPPPLSTHPALHAQAMQSQALAPPPPLARCTGLPGSQ